MIRKLCSVIALMVVVGVAGCAPQHAPSPASTFSPQPGDLLFQDLDGSPLCDAIEAVTQGNGNARLSHVAMVVQTQPQVKVVEATGPGVVITPLEKLLARSHDANGQPKVLVGRLRQEYRNLIPQAVAYAVAQVGKPYDKPFVMREDAFYCSELIYFAFKHANQEHPLFATAPMTFKEPTSGDFFPAWVDYYRKLGMPIPEGQPGLNPGGMSREQCVTIIHAYGKPAVRSAGARPQ